MRKLQNSLGAVLLAGMAAYAPLAWAETTSTDAANEATAAEATSADDAEATLSPEELSIQDNILGEADAPVTLYLYASFTCPHCQEFEATVMPEIQTNYIDTGKVNVIYREIYRDMADILAGSLSRCVPSEQFYPMVDALYEDVPNWLLNSNDAEDVVTGLTKIGVMAGLPKDQISECLDNRELQELRFNHANENAENDKVTGTPTLIVNGEHAPDASWEGMQKFLDEQLEKAGAM